MEYLRENWLKIFGIQLSLGVVAFFVFQQFFPAKMDKVAPVAKEVVVVEEEPVIPPPPPIKYSLVASKDTTAWLESLTAGDTLMALMVINRTDSWRLKHIDTLVFPDSIGVGIDMYAPFPEQVEGLAAVKKILFVSHYMQAFAVYENGERIKWGPVSLGRKVKPTPVGLFATNWKSKRTTSTINSSWILDWYFNLDNFEGIGMHQYALPGFPASHGCVRLYNDDANWLYHWADQWKIEEGKIAVYGSPVVIFGEYPYGEGRPWVTMAKDSMGLEITPAGLTTVTEEYLPIIMERQVQRDSLEQTKLLAEDPA
ncbi:MAG: L,D-transpeptidase [Crocinitomicaceae bacterium]|nr:L,D-transpeptidase [Crocinitomicaceae bacterium]